MPSVGFICEDGGEITKDMCYQTCRLGSRCMTLPMLRIAGQEREVGEFDEDGKWTGRLSVTQLGNGLLYNYLRITELYSVSPFEKIYALMGTKHHGQLETATRFGEFSEVKFDHPLFPGTADLLTEDPDFPGKYILTDNKLYGSYHMEKFLGLQYREVESETEVYQTSGTTRGGRKYRKGQPKIVREYYFDFDEADISDETWQLNSYRVGLRDGKIESYRLPNGNRVKWDYPHGIEVSKMYVCATIRDWGAMVRAKGFPRPVEMVEIPFIDDDWVTERAELTQHQTRYHIENNIMPDKCSDEETWQGRRCQSYCELRYICPHGDPK